MLPFVTWHSFLFGVTKKNGKQHLNRSLWYENDFRESPFKNMWSSLLNGSFWYVRMCIFQPGQIINIYNVFVRFAERNKKIQMMTELFSSDSAYQILIISMWWRLLGCLLFFVFLHILLCERIKNRTTSDAFDLILTCFAIPHLIFNVLNYWSSSFLMW